jgi:hypothetical protein
MIDDMALLKRTMQQMDAEDPTLAQAAKDHAAQILRDAKLNFAKMAELIEQRRLLLPPAILGRIKKMDQPGMLGDGAFQDTASALRREGQSFLQIAEAIEASNRPAPATRSNAPAPVLESEPLLYPMDDEPHEPAWLRALLFIGRIILFPVRHPLRSLAIGLFALVLLYGVRGVVILSEWASRVSHRAAAVERLDTAISSVKSFVHERISPQAKETSPTPDTPTPSPMAAAVSPPSATPSVAPAASPSPPPTPSAAPPTAPVLSAAPSPAPAAASAPPAAAPAPTASESAALAPPPTASVPAQAAPASPPDSPPRREARGAPPSRTAASRPRAFDDSAGYRRNSHIAGPCRGGVGGCYWGGTQF